MSSLSRLILITAVLALFSSGPVALAQHSNAYLFLAPGGVSSYGHTSATLHFGGGGEIALVKGFGLGAEIGVLGVTSSYGDSAVLTLSPDVYYHFKSGSEKLDPFVAGGYSAFIRSGGINLGNFGTGVNYWLRSGLGLRAEFRDHVNSGANWWGFRFGLVF